jgi:hypothetical protein
MTLNFIQTLAKNQRLYPYDQLLPVAGKTLTGKQDRRSQVRISLPVSKIEGPNFKFPYR